MCRRQRPTALASSATASGMLVDNQLPETTKFLLPGETANPKSAKAPVAVHPVEKLVLENHQPLIIHF